MTLSRAHEDFGSDDEFVDPKNGLVQYLGYENADRLPGFDNVVVAHSSDVHFGDKNVYNGPVTIKQVVYANGSATLADPNGKEGESPGGRDNVAFVEDGAEIGKRDEAETPRGDGSPRGFIWLQNASKRRPLEIAIFLAVVLLSLFVLLSVLFLKRPAEKARGSTVSDTHEQDVINPVDYEPSLTVSTQLASKLHIFSRIEWLAQPPVQKPNALPTPVPYVIIQHTATENCSSHGQCILHVRTIQMFHIESRGWWDIGYNFLVGGDGAAYEGRGWTSEGAHTLGYNSKSLGIAFIGTFVAEKPPEIQLVACQKLIQKGVDDGYVAKNYKLLAHRQLHTTESPGAALFQELQTWSHWAAEP
ncbi:peptidoglycan-recognition protein LC-like [Cylas formicarius]|uniref:peptidoglycan-recognition protein LC-like n=1 Tax=Cylas formicarius TaxID=197179 RepID=UPI0029589EA6|nr:peptidoglycan-recognition protein LC-like [Cylas formicarius]